MPVLDELIAAGPDCEIDPTRLSPDANPQANLVWTRFLEQVFFLL